MPNQPKKPGEASSPLTIDAVRRLARAGAAGRAMRAYRAIMGCSAREAREFVLPLAHEARVVRSRIRG